jgi:predicted PurR-regulated permease PerM
VLWGVPGMILSVPITAILRITCQHFDHPYAR